jgi:hypothetical protein
VKTPVHQLRKVMNRQTHSKVAVPALLLAMCSHSLLANATNAGGGNVGNENYSGFVSIGELSSDAYLTNETFTHVFDFGSRDFDEDGLPDAFETRLNTDASSNDSDEDSLLDGDEVRIGMNPAKTDQEAVSFFRSRFEGATEAERTSLLAEGKSTGISQVTDRPNDYGLHTSTDLNASVKAARESALTEGRTTGIAAVKANPEAYGLTLLQVLEAAGATPHTLNWYYQPEWGWLWTNKETFPYVYRSGKEEEGESKTSGWLYFEEGSSDPIRYFLYDPVQPEPPNGEPAGEWETLE